ncbi:MAG: secretin N-terminal domain-containing protein, partial [Nitrospirota bacterium]|nr:secretin N-terminal domain-containing protein [Nitrospirota bacterium]
MNLKLISLRLINVCLIILFISACGPKQAVKPDETVVVPPSAEELKLPDVQPPMDAKDDKKKPEKTAAEKKQDEQYVMLNFENADIETVVSTISDMLKINYILAPGVTGKITIQSHNKIPVSELFSTFQTVLEFNGFTAVKEGSFYRIVPIDTAKQQPVQMQMGKKAAPPKDSSFVTQQIPLEYVKATDVANLVRNLMPKGTDIIVYEPSNMLIVTSLPSGILKLLKLLESIDIPSTERDSVKTFIYHVENGEAKKLAEVLKNLYGKKSGAATPTPVKPAQPTPPPAAVPRPRTPAAATAAPVSATIQADILSAELEGDVLIEAYDDINALIIK